MFGQIKELSKCAIDETKSNSHMKSKIQTTVALSHIAILLAAAIPAMAAVQCYQTKGDADDVTDAGEYSCNWTYNEAGGDPECTGSCFSLTYFDKICKPVSSQLSCEFCDPENTASENVTALKTNGICEQIEESCICNLNGNPQFIQHPINAPTTGFDCETCPEGS